MTYQELLYSAINNALRGVQTEQSPAVDAVAIADTLFPVVSQAVCEAAAADPYRRDLVRRQKTLTLAAGEVVLPSDVLQDFMPDAVFFDPSNLSKKYAWRDYPDFVRRGDKRIGLFSVRGQDTLIEVEPNANFTVPLVATGARTMVVPCAIEKPTLATDDIVCPFQLLSDLDEALSNSLRGALIKESGANT